MRTKEFLSQLDHDRIVKAIAGAEAKTSGEIRVYIQRGKIAGDALELAQKKFQELGMTKTSERNAILILVAPRAQKFAVVGDEGVHQKCSAEFWQGLVDEMRTHLRQSHFTDALIAGIESAGSLLAAHFPRRPDDRNELPDEPVSDL